MKRDDWDKKVRVLLKQVLKNNKRQGGSCSCGAERFQAHYEGCEVAEIKHLLEVEVTRG